MNAVLEFNIANNNENKNNIHEDYIQCPIFGHVMHYFTNHIFVGGGERGQLLQPQDDPPAHPTSGALANNRGQGIDQQEPIAASWSFKTRFSSGIAHALARATNETRESASACDTEDGGGIRMLPPGQSNSFAWAAVQGKGRAVRLADGKPVGCAL